MVLLSDRSATYTILSSTTYRQIPEPYHHFCSTKRTHSHSLTQKQKQWLQPWRLHQLSLAWELLLFLPHLTCPLRRNWTSAQVPRFCLIKCHNGKLCFLFTVFYLSSWDTYGSRWRSFSYINFLSSWVEFLVQINVLLILQLIVWLRHNG